MFCHFSDNLIRNDVQTVESASPAVVHTPDARGTDYFRGTGFRTRSVGLPALPGILPMRALKESESTVDNRSMFSTTYLPIIPFRSVCVTNFCETGAKKSSFS